LRNLEQELVSAVRGRRIDLPLTEIRREGLVAVLRERLAEQGNDERRRTNDDL